MDNKLSTNNLFGYATRELTQDAFICWLLSHAMEENWNKDSQLRECAVVFLNKALECKNLYWKNDTRVTDIKRQYNNIDILVSIGDLKIIIEDKTFTGTHHNQFNRYKQTLVVEGIPADNILCVYYKIIEQAHPEKDVDFEFTRDILLDIFRNFKETSCGENAIFRDYLEYIESIDAEINSFKLLSILDWNKRSYTGFFKHLGNTLLKGEPYGWGYVSNPTGGFMGLWWYDILNNEMLNKIGLTEEYCDEIYLQIEENIVTIKYSLDADKYLNNKYDMNKIRDIRWKLFNYFNEILGDEFKKKPFRDGQYMTIGYIEYNENNYQEKIPLMREVLINMANNFSI